MNSETFNEGASRTRASWIRKVRLMKKEVLESEASWTPLAILNELEEFGKAQAANNASKPGGLGRKRKKT